MSVKSSHKHNNPVHHKHHHGSKHKSLSEKNQNDEDNDDGQTPDVETGQQLSSNEIESLRNNLVKIALPILLGTDGDTNKWQVNSGKNLDSGMIYTCSMPEFGTVWKVEFMLDCPPEVICKSVTEDLDISWIPNLKESHVLARGDDHCVLQQRIHGVTGVADRDFVFIQFSGKMPTKKTPTSPEVTTLYTMAQSIPDDCYNPVPSDCVRGLYLPQGWSWRPVEEHGKIRCHSILIYNLDLKGYIPKSIVNLAASAFLMKHVKAAQEHARRLVESEESKIIPSTPSPRPTTAKSKKKKPQH